MILKSLLVLLFGVNLSWTEPRETTTQTNTDEISSNSDLIFRSDYKYEPVTDMFYKEHTAVNTWSGAIFTCKVEGAELATPFTNIEKDVIQKRVRGPSARNWLGIHDLYSKGSFFTLNGTRILDTYIDWTPIRNKQENSHCLTMSEDGKYHIEPCNWVYAFICTKRRSEVTRNHDCETTSEGYVLDSETGHCYKFHTTPKTWREAFSTCYGEEATLPVPVSREGNGLFVKYLAKHPENTLKGNFNKNVIFLDVTDIITRGEFLTSKGQTMHDLGYRSDWAGNLNSEEHCGTVRRDGGLDYLGCNEKGLFMCVKILKNTNKPTDDIAETSMESSTLPETSMESYTLPEMSPEWSSNSDLSYRKDYVYEKETETYYKLHNGKRTWAEAIATCKQEGATLAQPFTQIEADMVLKHSIVPAEYNFGIWVGLHDLFIMGNFITLNGTWASEMFLANELKYQSGRQNCLSMISNKVYWKALCSRPYKFVCTKRRSEMIEPYECETTSEGYSYKYEAGRCYKVHTTPMTWREASRECDAEGASLAMANSEAEAKIFVEYMTDYTKRGSVIFLDFTDIIIRRQFFTRNGKTLEESGYSAWWDGQPHNMTDEEHCGIMRRDGQLDYLKCDDKALFMCEKVISRNEPLSPAKFDDKVPQEMSPTSNKNNETSDKPDLSFRKDYTYEAETDTFYKEHENLETWSGAVASCRSEGAELAAPVSILEAETIRKFFSGRSDHAWLGMHALFVGKQFVTLNGKPATDVYTNWEQNGKTNSEHASCVVMTNKWKYLNVSCERKNTYICTKRRSEIIWNHECETISKGYFLENFTGHCYKVHTTPATWSDAHSTCYNEGASLAMADSRAEAGLFVEYLAKYPKNTLKGKFKKDVVFLNFNDVITPGEFVTGNGEILEESGYSAWREGRPGPLSSDERCFGCMHRDGKLDHVSLKERALFICEKTLKHSTR